jgi:hypothetical protein
MAKPEILCSAQRERMAHMAREPAAAKDDTHAVTPLVYETHTQGI